MTSAASNGDRRALYSVAARLSRRGTGWEACPTYYRQNRVLTAADGREQAQPFPGAGVWLPTMSIFDINFRKFTFADSIHRKIYSSDYRRIGLPAESLPLLRKEHALSAGAPAVSAREY